MKEKIKNYLKRLKNGGYSIQWLDQQVKPYVQKLVKQQGMQIITSIPQQNGLALESRAKERFFNSVLEQKRYSFRSPLVIINPYRIAPLTALVLFHTETPCTCRITICGKNGAKDLVTAIQTPKTSHRLPIVGLYPDTRNKVIVELTGHTGQIRRKTLFLTTLPTAGKLNDIVHIRKREQEPSEEYIYVSGGYSKQSYAFDAQGIIRFYYNMGVKLYGTHMLSNGHLLFPECNISNPTFSNPHSTVFHEMDFMGRVYKTFMVEKGVHHFASEKGSGGNILLASSTLSETLGMENAVIEIDRISGEVVRTLDLNDLFDMTYRNRHDWAHINSIQYLPDEDTVVLSLRNLHSVVKVHWSRQELIWILGDPRFWEPTPMIEKVIRPESKEIAWFYQQHAAEVLSSQDGYKEILIYDNHMATRRPLEYFEPTDHSYLSVFHINEKNGTVTMKKHFSTYKSTIRSNGVCVKNKNRIWGMSANLVPRIEEKKGMVEEFDYETGRLLNQYALKYDYFSAYPVHFNAEEMSRPLDLSLPYEPGHVLQPEKVTREEIQKLGWNPNAEKADNAYFTSYILNRLLLVKETDNEIRNLYAVGKTHIYRLDKSHTVQRAVDTFGNARYYITFPLENCEPDTYTFYLQTLEKLYRLDRTVEIRKR